MQNLQKKPIVGMLGGIASGKSFVALEFAKLGCAVINADKLAHEQLLQEQTQQDIREHFGDEVFDAAGQIDRSALARAIFGDSEKVKILNSIIHPQVIHKCESLLVEYSNKSDCRAVVLDVPLLIEIGWDSRCDALVFVECEEANRIERALRRGLVSVDEFEKRENNQISLDKKREIAHYVVDNNSKVSAMADQLAQILSSVINNFC